MPSTDHPYIDYDELFQDTARRAARYRTGLAERRVAPTPEALARLAELEENLPETPTDAAEIVRLLDEIGSPAAMASAGGRFFGYVIGSSLPAAVAASWLVTAWDQEGGLEVAAPLGARLEQVCADWLIQLFSLPRSTGVGFVTGATQANFTALAAARHALLQRAGWDVERQGLFGAPPLNVIVSDEVHASILKALSLLGLGRERVLRVPTDDQGRMLPDQIPFVDEPAIICAQAGHVATGAFDPLSEICERAHAMGAWVHIDGAFGMWAAAAPERKHLVEGLTLADSWATDAHKWLNVPYDNGLVFVRNLHDLRAAMAVSAAYLDAPLCRQPDEYVPEMSRRARGVEVWAALKSLGRSGLADLIERCCRHAEFFARELEESGYTPLNQVHLNQVLVSFGNDEITRRVISALQAEGTCWCSGTVFHGHAAMRISVSSWATTVQDCEKSLEVMLRIAAAEKAR